ncbi:MAG TPA: hypothetical protein VN881_09445 [Candidatus Acidoferrales bacterium]|nr:hypothetical protein [Candidatus Acidoferrales bacterium]
MAPMKLPKKISFAAFCADILGEPISPGWVAAYKAFDGLQLTTSELDIWRELTGKDEYVQRDYPELTAIKGRRSQGTKTACKYLAYKIHTENYRRYAAKGDRLRVPIVAQSKDVAREIVSYLTDFYTNTDLASEVEADGLLKGSIDLKNGFIVSVQTCSFRAPRGITAPLALCDEVGIWRAEGADIDREVVRSLTPAMIQFPNRKLILLGSPWTKVGTLFDRWEHRFEDGDRLVLHCPTPRMNAMIPAEELAREEQSDPQNYRREFLAEWLDDVDQFLPDSDISAAIRTGIREQAYVDALKSHYTATIDASGLSGKDRFTFAIGHRSVRAKDRVGVSLDLLRGWSRRGVAEVVDEIAATLKLYGLNSVSADQFGFSFLKELLALRKIEVIQLAWSARSKPEIFLDLKLALAQGNLKLLDHPESLRELRLLECRRTSGGHSSISAPRGQHDDYACAIAMLNHQCKKNQDSGWGFIATSGGILR